MYITQADHDRLVSLMKLRASEDAARAALAGTLRGATVIASEAMPPDTVTMNSLVRLTDPDTGDEATYALVFPADANVDRNRISVLAPLGAAMLGRTIGEVIEMPTRGGSRRYRIEEIVYQPEASLRASAGETGGVG